MVNNIFFIDEENTPWPKGYLKEGSPFRNRIPSNIEVRTREGEEQHIQYIRDCEERKMILDGLGEGLPPPPSLDPYEEPFSESPLA